MTARGVQLKNESLQVECYPEHGFVIASIRRAGDTRNILWNPRSASFAPLPVTDLGPSGVASIDSFDLDVLAGGWFLMFPTAGPPGGTSERWMHGEAPRLAWEIVSSSTVEVVCRLHTPASGFEVQRTVRIDESSITVTTTATNVSGVVQQITFGEHPCFDRTVFQGGTLGAQPNHAETTSVADPLNATLVGNTDFLWPRAPGKAGGMTDLSVIPEEADGRHDHVSVRGLDSVYLEGLGIEVQMEWDANSMPNVLVWQHFKPTGSPWGGDVFAVEPSSASGRTLVEAESVSATTRVDPKQTITFWMTLRVSTSGSVEQSSGS